MFIALTVYVCLFAEGGNFSADAFAAGVTMLDGQTLVKLALQVELRRFVIKHSLNNTFFCGG